MTALDLDLQLALHEAVASVDDPEYPGISIVDLGLLERLECHEGVATIGLIPTFSGCPALATIASDVCEAVANVRGIYRAEVTWLKSPTWTIDRVSADAAAVLAKEFTVAVEIGKRRTRCPICGSTTTLQSMFGPSRCRSVHTCDGCGETVEVMRG